ncbi:MAG: hypothetical protein IPL31_08935 [Saprospiraceae bacterium]|nr:hypothetical protein [Saprospiraceae bacterium]
MNSRLIIYLLVVLFYQHSIGQNWKEYPFPSFGSTKYIEFYKDSMLLIQNLSNQCYVSFDLGQTWILSMNGFSGNDYPEYITLGKDLNYYAQIRDNVYRYSIKSNYWVWLFGGFDCKTNSENGFQVDDESNIYSYCDFYPSNPYKKSNYRSKNGDPYYYPANMIVLNKDKVINYHSERGTINFIDNDGGVNPAINVLKNKAYLFFSDHYQNMYFHDSKNVFIININTFRIDSVPLLSDQYYLVTKMYENQNHDLLISGFSFYPSYAGKKLLYSKDGGFSFQPFDHFIGKNYLAVDYLHFLADNNIIMEYEGFMLKIMDLQRAVNFIPGKSILPQAFIKSRDAEYFNYYNKAVFYKLNNELDYKPLVIDSYFEFNNLFKDNEGTVYVYNPKINCYYYKLINSSDWIKVNTQHFKYPIVRYLTDENGIVYALDSLTISYTKDKGINWNELFVLPNGETTYRITSVDNSFYFSVNDTLHIIDPLNSDSKVFPLSGYYDISNTKKVIYYEYIPGFIKGSYKFYILDSLQATPRLFYYSSEGLRYSKFNNSFWLFNNSGIYNLLNKDYYYSSEGLPDNSASNIVIVNISVDDEGYLYAITDMGVFFYKDRVNDQVTSVGDLETISNIKIFPNPASSYLNIMSQTRMESIEIISTNLKIIMRENVQSNLFLVNISTLSPDLYFLKCNFGSGKFQLEKFIKLK